MTVCKQIERSVVKFCRSLFHLILPNVKVKMPILWIFYYLILMLASSFWVVVFFPSLSSADKTEKDMFECQILASRTPLKWLPFLIHENKSLELLTTQTSNTYLYSQFFFVCRRCFLCLGCSLFKERIQIRQLALDLTKTDCMQKSKHLMKCFSKLRNSRDIRFMPQIRAGVTFIKTFYL